LYADFLRAFSGANQTIITDIYASLREAKDLSITSKRLAEDIARQEKNVQYIPTGAEVVQYIAEQKFGANSVLVFMGAGDIYKAIDTLTFRDHC
jgi:UDP-N-acetylmuramate-alanine ligase